MFLSFLPNLYLHSRGNPKPRAPLHSLLQPLARTLHLLRCSGKGNKPTSLWTTNHQWHVLACDPCGIYGMTVNISAWDKKRSCATAIVTHSSILLSSMLSCTSTRTGYILYIIIIIYYFTKSIEQYMFLI